MLGASLLLVSVVRLIYSLRTRPAADIEAGHSTTKPAEYQPR
jgi:hypothetical protein